MAPYLRLYVWTLRMDRTRLRWWVGFTDLARYRYNPAYASLRVVLLTA